MQFFDDKQEVMDVVVTPYGKHLLSQGVFKPEYYAFFDDDILYDSLWVSGSSISEAQNAIEGRIQEETPRVKQQSTYLGVESTIEMRNMIIRDAISDVANSGSVVVQDSHNFKIYGSELLQGYGDKFNFLATPLGRSAQTSDKLPAWNVSMIKGQISSSQNYMPMPSGSVEQIPQLDINLNYKVYVSEVDGSDMWTTEDVTVDYGAVTFPTPDSQVLTTQQVPDSFPVHLIDEIASQVYSDGSFLSIQNGKIIIDILEENVLFKKENFDVQIFLSSSNFSALNGNLQQLYFTDDTSDPQSDEVETYLTIRTDKGIDDARISRSIIGPLNSLVTDRSTTNVVSTREFLVRDLYDPEEDICE